jgi:hypothetical protein
MKTRVAIIAVYFGPFPKTFEAFKITAKFNQDYDWFIFTDQVKKVERESNITYFPYNMATLNKKLSYIFDIPIKLTERNCICDLRPIFAEIFETFLIGYNWWGWTDLDLLNGNFSKYLNDDIFDNYDAVNMTNKKYHDEESLNGSFMLLSMSVKHIYRDINNFGQMIANGDPEGRYGCLNTEEREFFDAFNKNNLKLYKGKYIDNHLTPIIRYGKRKLPVKWINGNLEVQSYKEDYYSTYVERYGCDTMVFHMPKRYKNIFIKDNEIEVN